jgi:hypothetical protein
MADSAAEIVRSGYDAFAKGDIPSVLAIFADDIAWTIGGRSPLAGTYTGHDEVLGFFGKLQELSGGTFHLDIEQIFDNGADTAVVLATEKAEREGRQLDEFQIHLWRLDDGKTTSFQAFPADDYVVDEFWS